MSETETIARNLSGELARHRKTQATLAKELGMSEKTVSERLRGKGAFDTEQLERNVRHEPLPAHDQAHATNRRHQTDQAVSSARRRMNRKENPK